jgi:electron transport complex protein RnfE
MQNNETKAMAHKRHLSAFTTGIIKDNPLFVMVLGTCPALAVTTSFEQALGMGLLFTFVLICSNVLVSALRKIIPESIETPAYIVIIAAFVTIVKMLTNAYLPELYDSLGVFLSLLVVNCIVLGRSEAFANKNTVLDSLLDGIGCGIGYTLALLVLGLLREILGTGALVFGRIFTFLPYTKVNLFPDYAMSLFQNPAGGFIVFGLVLAVINLVTLHKQDKQKVKARQEMLARRQQAALKKPNPAAVQAKAGKEGK